MRRLLVSAALGLVALASAARAADLGVAAPTYSPSSAVTYNWNGFYLGLEGGGNWGNSQHFFDDPSNPALIGLAQTAGIDLSGGLFGGTVGYNYQLGPLLLGLEDDMSWTNQRGSAGLIAPFNQKETFTTDESWIATLRGRAGIAWNRWLFFGTGGAALAGEGINLCDPIHGCGSQSSVVAGWTAGGGAEFAFSRHWSFKLEYLHADFGSHYYSITPNNGGHFASRQVSLDDNIVRVGLNYKF